jgi:hypothetical protein
MVADELRPSGSREPCLESMLGTHSFQPTPAEVPGHETATSLVVVYSHRGGVQSWGIPRIAGEITITPIALTMD